MLEKGFGKIDEENLTSSMVSNHAKPLKRPKRSSTLRFNDKDNLEFTLGAGGLVKSKSPLNNIFRGRQQ